MRTPTQSGRPPAIISVLRALDLALKVRLEQRPVLEFGAISAGSPPAPDWRGDLNKLIDYPETATSGQVIRLALAVPEKEAKHLRVLLAGFFAALDQRSTRPLVQPKAEAKAPERLLTTEEVAARLNLSVKKVRAMKTELGARSFGHRTLRYPESKVEAFARRP